MNPKASFIKILQISLLFILLIFVSFFLYFLYWTPTGTGYLQVNLAPYQKAWENSGKEPMAYILEKCQKHSIVIVGEFHRRAEDPKFICNLIPKLAKVDVHFLGIEFGFDCSQDSLEKLMKKESFDRELAKQILLDTKSHWYFEEYLQLFKTAFDFNKERAKNGKPFRIILLNPGIRGEDGIINYRGNRDQGMAKTILKYVEKGNKMLVYCGSNHGFSKFQNPTIPFIQKERMGNILYKKLGTKVFFVQLHQPVFKRWAIFLWPLYSKKFLYPFAGIIDKTYAIYNKPVGFDTSLKPFADLVDQTSAHSAYHQTLKLSDFADGYIITKPLSEFSKVRAIENLGTNRDLQYLKQHLPKKEIQWENKEELLQFIEKDLASYGPEKIYNYIDQSGYNKASWLPTIRAIYPFLFVAILCGFLWKWRKQKSK